MLAINEEVGKKQVCRRAGNDITRLENKVKMSSDVFLESHGRLSPSDC
jgi:hypothetical protein